MKNKDKRRRLLQKQVQRLAGRIESLQERSGQFSRWRLLVFLSGFGLGVALYYAVAPLPGWSVMAATLVVFNIVAFFHRRLLRCIKRHEIWHELRATQLARIQLDWERLPSSGRPTADAEHPFDLDIDISGKRSLHRLLDTSLSAEGSALLRDWLLATQPEPESIHRRSRIVRELTPLRRFRDRLHLAFRLVSQGQLEGQKLLRFLNEQHAPAGLGKIFFMSLVLACASAALFVLNLMHLLPAWWGITLAIYGGVYLANQGFLDSLLDDAVLMAEELKKLKSVLIFLERYDYGTQAGLRQLCQPFWQGESRPSRELRRLTGLGFAIGLRMNPLFRLVLNLAVPYDFYLVGKLNRAERQLRDKLGGWLDAIVELEALNSLANFADLNPETIFPTILDDDGAAPVLTVEALGHPLIADESRRCNDFSLAASGDIALVTGSNMSGKSTFLKTVGINLALAFAGGPVVAQRFETRAFRLYTCIQINDSIADGFSFFYSEVRRLKALLTALQHPADRPLFFLIDEIFKGTNNRERLIGSRSFIQALAGRNGAGIISTHDLELTSLSESIPAITNYHFREQVVDGRMVFDYQMRPGPCPSTNALKIMRMEGLPVDDVQE